MVHPSLDRKPMPFAIIHLTWGASVGSLILSSSRQLTGWVPCPWHGEKNISATCLSYGFAISGRGRLAWADRESDGEWVLFKRLLIYRGKPRHFERFTAIPNLVLVLS
jgi:hypothetical protein